MRKRLIICCACVLLIVGNAYAAPTREMTQQALLHPDVIQQIQPLADLVSSAAWEQKLLEFADNTKPEQALVEEMLKEALKSHLLVYGAAGESILLSDKEAAKAAGQLFSHEELPAISQPINQDIIMKEGLLRFDLSSSRDFIGASIYDIRLSEEEFLVFADIYRLNGIVASAAEAPEDSLVWLGNIRIKLLPEAASAVGFTLSGFRIPETYQAQGFILYEEKDLFELQYPDIFARAKDEPGTLLSLKHPDGQASLRVSVFSGTLDMLQAAWSQEEGPREVTKCRISPDCRINLRGPGLYRIAVYNPINDQDACLVLELRYPENQRQEYSLYYVFIENSFIVYSNAVG